MESVVSFAESFIGFMQKAGGQFSSMLTGTIPMLVTLLTLVHFIVRIIGEEKINKFASLFGRYKILAYGVLPSLAWFFFSSPGAVAVGRFLPERCKPGYEDALGAIAHPLTSLFPHVVPAELFIWLGVAEGIKKLGLPLGELAVRYIIAGIILGLIRGIITEYIFVWISKRNGYDVDQV